MKTFETKESIILSSVGNGQIEIYMGKAVIPWYIVILDFFKNSFRIFTKPL